MNEGPAFERYIDVDYPGAETPISSLRGLRAYCGSRTMPATEVAPPRGPRKYWTRRGLAEWLADLLDPSVVSCDSPTHSLDFESLPFRTTQVTIRITPVADPAR
jgi:hypothetical protein